MSFPIPFRIKAIFSPWDTTILTPCPPPLWTLQSAWVAHSLILLDAEMASPRQHLLSLWSPRAVLLMTLLQFPGQIAFSVGPSSDSSGWSAHGSYDALLASALFLAAHPCFLYAAETPEAPAICQVLCWLLHLP